MRKISEEACLAFNKNEQFYKDNTHITVDDNIVKLYLHGNCIAKKDLLNNNKLEIQTAGWFTSTTKERLNTLLRLNNLGTVYQRGTQWFYKGIEWDGSWMTVYEN
jgi:hypothetical protein